MSISMKRKMAQWQTMQRANDYEMERLAILNGPLPKNDPQLFTPTRCKVIKSFCIAGRPTQPGEIVSIPYNEAIGLRAIGKIEIVE